MLFCRKMPLNGSTRLTSMTIRGSHVIEATVKVEVLERAFRRARRQSVAVCLVTPSDGSSTTFKMKTMMFCLSTSVRGARCMGVRALNNEPFLGSLLMGVKPLPSSYDWTLKL